METPKRKTTMAAVIAAFLAVMMVSAAYAPVMSYADEATDAQQTQTEQPAEAGGGTGDAGSGDASAETGGSEGTAEQPAEQGNGGASYSSGGGFPTAEEVVEGFRYEPDEMLPNDGSVVITEEKIKNAPGALESMVAIFIRFLLPYVAIGSVIAIIYNTIANFFRPEEERLPMIELLKRIITGFFMIIFSFLIVEVIMYVILGGEVWLSRYLAS